MEIKFTKKQYASLLKLVYLGNSMANDHRPQDVNKEFVDVMNVMYSHADEFGCGSLIKKDEEDGKFYSTDKLEEEVDLIVDAYDEHCFWEELINRLADRDFIHAIGEAEAQNMDWIEFLEKKEPYMQKYADEFYAHGIENLVIK
jgi:hypothetical protein